MTSPPRPHVLAAAPPRVRQQLEGPSSPAPVLGRSATALYLRVAGGDVIALLSTDAVQLPIGVVLPMSSRELPLSSLSGPVVVGSGVVHVGGWSCHVSRTVSVRAPAGLIPDPRACEQLSRRLAGRSRTGLDPHLLDALPDDLSRGATADVVRRLLGSGPGLTPAGDDVLAGALVGLWCFGHAVEPLRSAVLAAAPSDTTDLSAALLRCAARGESIPQVNRLLQAMSGSGWRGGLDRDLDALVQVGHTSGAAMATGVLAAAKVVSHEQRQAPAGTASAVVEIVSSCHETG